MNKTHIYIPFDALSATGQTPAKSAQFGSSYPRTHAAQLIITGAPSGVSLTVEGRLPGGAWLVLATLTDGVLAHVVDKPVMEIRGNLGTLTGGTSPTVQLLYLGVA